MNRQETLDALNAQPNVSVLIVGGGVNGISAFRELALNGVDVLLVDKGDFSSGASAASSHMVHGGLRYLENGEFRLVREALTERNRLLQNAPHYVRPLPTTIPIFKWLSGTLNAPLKFLGLTQKPAERGAFIIQLGLTMYDLFASTQKSMPNHSFMAKDEALKRFPGINQEIVNAATYYDAWMPYPERICLELVLDAEAMNPRARALNYVSVMEGSGDSVTLHDEISGEQYTVKPTVVINAAGPWIDFANANLTHQTNFIGGTKGSHLVIDHPQLLETLGGHEIFFENDDGRIVLIFPLEDRILAGTTDIRIDNPDDAVCTDDEIEYILTLVTKVFPDLDISRDDVVFTFSGVRPLPAQDAASTGQISRDHSVKTVPAGQGTSYPIHSLIGGKWTTFRAFGEKVADQVMGELGMQRQVSTVNAPIGGGLAYPKDPVEQRKWVSSVASQTGLSKARVQTLFERYGTRARAIAIYCAEDTDTPLENMPSYSRREVMYVTAFEKTLTVEDFVLRRSLLAMLGKLNTALVEEIAAVMAKVHGWKKAETKSQIEATLASLREKNLIEVTDEGTRLVSEVTPEPA